MGEAKRAPKKRAPQFPDAVRTHHELAVDYLAQLSIESGGTSPVTAEGSLWTCRAGVWRTVSLDESEMTIAEMFPTDKLCRKGSDYRQIAVHAMKVAGAPEFFEDVPRGFAAEGRFYRVAPDGTVTDEPLRPEHRVRFSFPVKPDPEAEAPEFYRWMEHAFAGEDAGTQVLRFGEVMGGTLTGALVPLQAAVLFFGPGQTGKSTAARLLESLLPADVTASVTPHEWQSEYSRAHLAGKRLNIVGELDADSPIPSGAFKAVTGQDLLLGRHPTHRPFEFRNSAVHVFVSNHLPVTRDRTDAFFRRWQILEFRNVVPAASKVADLADLIVSRELGPVLSFALDGAARLLSAGRMTASGTHARLLAKWQASASSVTEFLTDDEAIALGPEFVTPRRALYEAFRKWAGEAGRKVLGAKAFYQEIEETGARIGVGAVKLHGERVIRGARIIGGGW